MAKNGLAIRLPSGNRLLSIIQRTGYVALHGRPIHLQIPGALVALIQENGRVGLIARAR